MGFTNLMLAVTLLLVTLAGAVPARKRQGLSLRDHPGENKIKGLTPKLFIINMVRNAVKLPPKTLNN
jgi:hypothetical protein